MSIFGAFIGAIDRSHERRLTSKNPLMSMLVPSRIWVGAVMCIFVLSLASGALPEPLKTYYLIFGLGLVLAFVTLFLVRLGVTADRVRKQRNGDANV